MRRLTGLLLFAVFILIFSLGQSVSFYTDWLWFQEVGYTAVFTTVVGIKLLLPLLSGGLFFLCVYANLKFAARTVRGMRFLDYENALELPSPELIDPFIRRLLLPACLLLGFVVAPQSAGVWENALLFFNAMPFGLQDPVFGNDIGFYIFRLPLLSAVYNWLVLLLALTTVATAAAYILYRGVQYGRRGLSFST